MDTNEVSRVELNVILVLKHLQALARSAQKQFNARVETIVSRGNFLWNSPGARQTDVTCKLDLFQFHALIFQTDNVSINIG